MIIIYSIIAGVLGTGIGGVLGVVIGEKGSKFISAILSLASGIMLAVVFFDLIPEACEIFEDKMVTLLGLCWGVVIMVLLNRIIDHFTNKVSVTIKALKGDKEASYRKLKNAGIFLMLAIALHNIPEGMAIGASGAVEHRLGLTLAIVICLHDIPEGVAISLPLSVGKVGKVKSVVLTVIAGLMTVVGCVIGVLIGSVSTIYSAFFLAFAGGAMLQVTLCEMIPDALKFNKDLSSFYYILVGIFLGFVVNILL